MRGVLVALAISLAVFSGARAQEVGELLSGLGFAVPPKEGQVRVVARLEVTPAGGVLRLEFVGEGDARLVADPGITVTGLASETVRWPEGAEVRAVVPGQLYFPEPPRILLPVEAVPGATVEADVAYAWCLVGWQCRFGNERVRLAWPEANPEPAG